MDKILKEINLDDFTGRLATKIPSVEAMKDGTFSGSSYTDWGQLPYDVVVYLKQPDGTVGWVKPMTPSLDAEHLEGEPEDEMCLFLELN